MQRGGVEIHQQLTFCHLLTLLSFQTQMSVLLPWREVSLFMEHGTNAQAPLWVSDMTRVYFVWMTTLLKHT